jgi:5-hydroxyisourate hydrolase-like protein (transthyretin family)
MGHNSGNLLSRFIYEYFENGLLKKYSVYSGETGEVEVIQQFNNTYRDPLMDIVDTIFFNGRIHPVTGEYHPPYRYYYNNRQADSSYFEEYYQIWDGEKWNTEEKTYVHLLDTASVSEFQDHVEIFNRYGQLKEGIKTFLTFDDQGNVIEAFIESYDVASGQYQTSYKAVYLYNEEGKCHTCNFYFYTTSGTWGLMSRFTDMEWFEFHGFSNGDMLFYGEPAGLYKFYSPKNKNKISNLKYWELCGGSMRLSSIDSMEWKLSPFSYHCFFYTAYNMCLMGHNYYEYNEHYHFTSHGLFSYDAIDCDTIPYLYVQDDFTNKYDDRGRRYEYIHYNSWFPPYDTITHSAFTYTVDSFTYVLRPVDIPELPADKHTLLIVPNPSDETVRITATDDIATVSIYASDGRLAYSRDGAGKEMRINVQGLASGVYVVQARLKNGGMQTGKVVVR